MEGCEQGTAKVTGKAHSQGTQARRTQTRYMVRTRGGQEDRTHRVHAEFPEQLGADCFEVVLCELRAYVHSEVARRRLLAGDLLVQVVLVEAVELGVVCQPLRQPAVPSNTHHR